MKGNHTIKKKLTHSRITPTDAFKTLTVDARDLLVATEDAAEEKIVKARERLAATLETGKSGLLQTRDRALARARSVDRSVHTHPYPVVGLALGIGGLLGFLFARRP